MGQEYSSPMRKLTPEEYEAIVNNRQPDTEEEKPKVKAQPRVQISPEEKEYLVVIVPSLVALYTELTENEDIQYTGEATLCNGRKEAYELIKNYILDDPNDGIDIRNSFVLVTGVKLEGRQSIFRFMRYCRQFYKDDDFDIDDYFNEYRELFQDDNIPVEEDNKPQASGYQNQSPLMS